MIKIENFHILCDTTSNNRRVLEVVETQRDLGVVISNDLKWHHQVARAASKANQIASMILNAFNTREPDTIKRYTRPISDHI